MSTYSSVAALKPTPGVCALTFSTITEPSSPALLAIWRTGSSRAFFTILMPTAVSPEASIPSRAGIILRNAVPPPGTIPSSTAARVALRASSIRSFFSFNSVSVAAPTSITATPPDSLARRSWSFSRSKSEVVSSISVLIWAILFSSSAWSPAPPTITVSSFFTLTWRARPSCWRVAFSSLIPMR